MIDDQGVVDPAIARKNALTRLPPLESDSAVSLVDQFHPAPNTGTLEGNERLGNVSVPEQFNLNWSTVRLGGGLTMVGGYVMRAILLISAATLALSACQKSGDGKTTAVPGAAVAPGSSGGALSLASLPTRKAGLWQQAMSRDGAAMPMGAMKICVDAASDAKMSLLGERMRSDKDCQRSFSRGLDGSFSYSSTCKMGEAGVISSKGVITGDFGSSYTVKSENDITGAAVASMNGHHAMEIQSTYLGPCPAGMSGGDMTLANGMTFNAAKMAAMAGGGAAKP